jgi:hypothetical protein
MRFEKIFSGEFVNLNGANLIRFLLVAALEMHSSLGRTNDVKLTDWNLYSTLVLPIVLG